nr:MAG TPA: hypothetical protein [Caudoviricetes sp.]
MESENKTVQLPQTSLGMHNLVLDLIFELQNVYNCGLDWDLDPENLEKMAAAAKIIRKISDYCGFDKDYDGLKERRPELVKKLDKAYREEEE